MTRSIFLATAFAFALTASASAGEAPRQAIVRYDDINIHQKAGARVLFDRIEVAAGEVCGPAPDIRALKLWGMYKDCVRTAQQHAIASLPFDMAAALQSDVQTVAAR